MTVREYVAPDGVAQGLDTNPLTGVRALAAWMVYLFHGAIIIGAQNKGLFLYLHELYMGVIVFFVLSGFLIAWHYDHKAVFQKAWWGRYLMYRFARVYPVFFLILLCNLLLDTYPLKTWFLQMSLMFGLFDPTIFSHQEMAGMPHTWTLTVEEMFYFSAPLVFILSRRWGLFWPLLCVYLLGGVLLFAGSVFQIPGLFTSPFYVMTSTYFGLAFAFFAGIFLSKGMREQQFGWVQKIPFRTYTGVAFLGALIFAMSKLALVAGPPHFQGFRAVPWGMLIYLFGIPAATTWFFHGLMTEKTLFSRFLNTRTMQLLGRSSYVFYVIHLGNMSDKLMAAAFQWSDCPLLVHFLITLVISTVIYQWIEEPIRKRIRGWADRLFLKPEAVTTQ